MNTGTKLETDNLYLLPGSNARDNEPFLRMLRDDGDFRDFCGIDFSEKYLMEFNDYFERSDHEQCMYAIFTKDDDEYIGYVGFHSEENYEIEFYIARPYRKKGYCEEACKKVISLIFSDGISVDGKRFCVDKLYATTLAENTAVHGLLTKLGFKRDVPEDGGILIMEGFVDEDTDEFYGYCVSKYVIEKR